MDLHEARVLQDVLDGTPWLQRTREFGRALRRSARTGLLLFGPRDDEPWHLTAHLEDEARFAGIPELAPTLVRWSPPPDAPAHLSVGLDRLTAARRGESVLVVAATTPPPLLERVEDVRRRGANVFALDTGDTELATLAHETLSLEAAVAPIVSFEGAQHLVSLATTHAATERRGLRRRLGRLLDALAGPDRHAHDAL
jgi:hypothetical protein